MALPTVDTTSPNWLNQHKDAMLREVAYLLEFERHDYRMAGSADAQMSEKQTRWLSETERAVAWMFDDAPDDFWSQTLHYDPLIVMKIAVRKSKEARTA